MAIKENYGQRMRVKATMVEDVNPAIAAYQRTKMVSPVLIFRSLVILSVETLA